MPPRIIFSVFIVVAFSTTFAFAQQQQEQQAPVQRDDGRAFDQRTQSTQPDAAAQSDDRSRYQMRRDRFRAERDPQRYQERREQWRSDRRLSPRERFEQRRRSHRQDLFREQPRVSPDVSPRFREDRFGRDVFPQTAPPNVSPRFSEEFETRRRFERRAPFSRRIPPRSTPNVSPRFSDEFDTRREFDRRAPFRQPGLRERRGFDDPGLRDRRGFGPSLRERRGFDRPGIRERRGFDQPRGFNQPGLRERRGFGENSNRPGFRGEPTPGRPGFRGSDDFNRPGFRDRGSVGRERFDRGSGFDRRRFRDGERSDRSFGVFDRGFRDVRNQQDVEDAIRTGANDYLTATGRVMNVSQSRSSNPHRTHFVELRTADGQRILAEVSEPGAFPYAASPIQINRGDYVRIIGTPSRVNDQPVVDVIHIMDIGTIEHYRQQQIRQHQDPLARPLDRPLYRSMQR